MADRTIEFLLIAKDQASNAISKVGDTAKSSAGHLSALGATAAVAFGNLAAQGATALASFGADAIKTGIQTASSMQQAQIGFTQLLGSAQKAGDYVKDLQQFAAATPFEFNGLVDSSRLLLGVGVSAKQVIPMLTDFGDAAGALAIDQSHFQNIMLATSQAISAGKFQVGDLNQLMTNGLPVWNILSKAMGKPVSVLRDMASKGQLLAKDVLPALQSEMHKDYGGAMAKQSQTLAGLWSTLQDTFSQGMAQVLQPLVPLLQQIMPGAINVLSGAFSGFSSLLGGVVGGVVGFGKAVTDVGTPIGEFAYVLTHLGQGLSDDDDDVARLAATIRDKAVAAFQGLSAIVSSVVGWFRNSLMPALTAAAQGVLPHLQGMIQSVTQTFREHQDVVQFVGNVFKLLGLIVTQIIIPVLGQVVSVLLDVLGPAFRAVMDIISTFVIPGFKLMTQGFLIVVQGILDGAARAFGWVPGVGPKLQGAADQFRQFAKDANAALDGIKDKTVNITVVARNTQAIGHLAELNALAGARAAGGPVAANKTYLVGERGPELFIPGNAGTIVPNGSFGRAAGAGGTVVVQMSQGFIGSPDQLARALSDVIRRAQAQGTGLSFA